MFKSFLSICFLSFCISSISYGYVEYEAPCNNYLSAIHEINNRDRMFEPKY